MRRYADEVSRVREHERQRAADSLIITLIAMRRDEMAPMDMIRVTIEEAMMMPPMLPSSLIRYAATCRAR